MKAIFAALIMMMAFPVVSFAEATGAEAQVREDITKGCAKWRSGKLLANKYSDPMMMLGYAIGTAEKLTTVYGPFEVATSNSAFGFGVKQGVSYQSLCTAYDTAMLKMTDKDVKSLITLVASHIVSSPKNAYYKHDELFGFEILHLTSIIPEDLDFGVFFHWSKNLQQHDVPFSPVYKQLWLSLANGDANAFVKTIRENSDDKSIKEIDNEYCSK